MSQLAKHVFAARAAVLGATVLLALLPWNGRPALAEGVYGAGLFELGDSAPPPGMPGMAELAADPALPGPDWENLFDATGKWRDDYPYDEFGNPLGNGVPDYQELFGGEWAVLAADDVSMGAPTETSAFHAESGGVYRASADADHDLGLAYVYTTRDAEGVLVIYGALERLGSGASELQVEINQDHFRLGHGGFGHGLPWEVRGDRAAGDLRLSVALGAAPGASVLEIWDGEAWQALTGLPGEGCDAAQDFCLVANVGAIPAGPWAAALGTPGELDSGRFLEFGLRLPEYGSTPPAYKTVQLKTPQDVAFGYFGEEN